MAVELNHTIVASRDLAVAAGFLADVLGLDAPRRFGPFLVVEAANGVSLDFIQADSDDEIAPQHYAFLVGDEEFDAIFARLVDRNVPYWADPAAQRLGEINTAFGGRGCYFPDPSGHWLEIITRPYGSS